MNKKKQLVIQTGVGAYTVLSALAITMAATGCSKSTTPAAAASGVSLKGSLAATTTTARVRPTGKNARAEKVQSYTGDSVVCTTMASPPTTATAAVAADGSFTITVDGGVNQPMNCNLVDSTGTLLAAIVTSDADNKDMSGNPTTQSTMAYSASANLGTISYDPSTGKASVPVANIKTSLAAGAAAASVYDPSGEWTIAAVPFTLPKGYTGLCANNADNCNGPPAGQLLALEQFKGVQTSDGTTPVYGLQIWQGGAAAATACGNVTGMTTAEAAAVGVDLSASGKVGAFTYASTVTIDGVSHQLSNDYQVTGATSEWSTQVGCGSQTITANGVTGIGWVCADDQGKYQASFGGGCVVTSTGKPMNMSGGWSPDNGNACTNTDLGGGYSISSCTGTTNDNAHTPVTCTNEYGVFTDPGLTVPNTSGSFDWNYLQTHQIAAGTACGSGSFSALQQAQCYAQYFQKNVGHNSTACLKRVDTDWSASTPANFLHIGNNPGSLVAFNEFHPDPTGLGGGMRMEQNNIQGVQAASGQGYTACHTFEVDEFTYKKLDATTLLAGYQSTTITTDTSIPDCVATYGTAGNGSVQKFMFLLKK